MKDPYISFVVVARNDNYGGNFLNRMQVFINTLSSLCEKYLLNSELIIVEWNPPENKDVFLNSLIWPKNIKKLKIRIITVSSDLHKKIAGTSKMPMFEFLAKNVGVRRAKGRFILVTNPDIIFNHELIKFLSKKNLFEKSFYRVNRHDLVKEIPSIKRVQKIFDFCENNWSIVHTRYGSFNKKFPYFNFNCLKSLLLIFRERIVGGSRSKIHTSASGDFFLMASSQWNKLRGYPEISIPCFLDSYMCFIAISSGLSQIILDNKKRIYHQKHKSFLNRNDYYKEYQLFKNRAEKMVKEKKPLILNSKNWGLAEETLEEEILN